MREIYLGLGLSYFSDHLEKKIKDKEKARKQRFDICITNVSIILTLTVYIMAFNHYFSFAVFIMP